MSDFGLDLTVDGVYEFKSAGALDYGGGEEDLSDLNRLKPVKRFPDDDYGWWELGEGIYILSYNEEIDVGQAAGLILPLPRLLKSGARHVPLVFTGELESDVVLLMVGPQGIDIKENARISQLRVWR